MRYVYHYTPHWEGVEILKHSQNSSINHIPLSNSMNFNEAFQPEASIEALRGLFLSDVLSHAFQAALDKALENLWKHGQAPESTQKILSYGLGLFVSSIKKISPKKTESLLEIDHLILKMTRNHSIYDGTVANGNFEDVADITALRLPQKILDSKLDLADGMFDLSSSSRTEAPLVLGQNLLNEIWPEANAELIASKIYEDDDFAIVKSAMAVFGQVFREIATIFENEKINLLPRLFQDPAKDSLLHYNHIHVFLAYLNVLMAELLDRKQSRQFALLDDAILLLYEMVATLSSLMAVERLASSSEGSASKELFKMFFCTDFSAVFGSILIVTTPPLLKNKEEDAIDDESIYNMNQCPKIEYKTLLRLLALITIFGSCPSSFLSIDKESLFLDMGSTTDLQNNVYRNFQTKFDFSKWHSRNVIMCRFGPMLSALYNYFYDLAPDLLHQSMNHSSFFGWITGHTFAPDLYMSVDTKALHTKLEDALEKSDFPFIDTEDIVTSAMSPQLALKLIAKKVFELPSYFIMTLFIRNFATNESFVKYLTDLKPTDDVRLLDIWLCVSSYVSQHQKISSFGRAGVKASLFVLLKFTANKQMAKGLKTHKINENIWKLCHQKAPFLPLSPTSELSALLYIIDVLQITLRFNISKHFNLDNVKMALTVLYQILLECEARPFEDLNNYNWKEMYDTLVHFILFVSRNRNAEDVKYVVEEVFSIFNLILSPTFAKVIEKSPDYFIVGSHIIKSMNYDLFYIILHEYTPLLQLFEKLIVDETNFKRVRHAFNTLEEEFELKKSKEIDESTVIPILNKLSLLSDDIAEETVLDFSKFNYAETFKFYLDPQSGDPLDEEGEYLDLIIQLFKKR